MNTTLVLSMIRRSGKKKQKNKAKTKFVLHRTCSCNQIILKYLAHPIHARSTWQWVPPYPRTHTSETRTHMVICLTKNPEMPFGSEQRFFWRSLHWFEDARNRRFWLVWIPFTPGWTVANLAPRFRSGFWERRYDWCSLFSPYGCEHESFRFQRSASDKCSRYIIQPIRGQQFHNVRRGPISQSGSKTSTFSGSTHCRAATGSSTRCFGWLDSSCYYE